MSPLFFVLVGPILVFLVIWAAAAAYRLYFPERAFPFAKGDTMWRAEAMADEEYVPVGVREIRARQRREQRQEDVTIYNYAWGASEGVPEAWKEDLWHRRN
jgi:hypothetical protein